jgi:hypothetical protein
MPRETDCPDSPSALAMPPRLGLSSIQRNDKNIESDISISFLPRFLPLTATSNCDDDGRAGGTHFGGGRMRWGMANLQKLNLANGRRNLSFK